MQWKHVHKERRNKGTTCAGKLPRSVGKAARVIEVHGGIKICNMILVGGWHVSTPERAHWEQTGIILLNGVDILNDVRWA